MTASAGDDSPAGVRALSVFWFLYFAANGITFPFYGLYLADNAGLSGLEVGTVVTMPAVVGLVAPTLWARCADRARRPVRLLAAAALGVAVCTAALGLLDGFHALVAGTAVLALFSTATVPMAVAISLATLGPRAGEFGRIRVAGTIGFLLLVVGFPPALAVLERATGATGAPGGPDRPLLALMFAVAGALYLAAAVSSLAIPPARTPAASPRRGDRSELLRNTAFLRGLAFAFLAWLFITGPMSLFPVYVRARGGGLDDLSWMWIVMLVPEIPLMAYAGLALRRVGARGLLAGGIAAGGLRWLVCGLSDDLAVVYTVQALHGALVAGVSIGGPLFIDGVVPERVRSTAQALFAVAGVGAGGIASNLIAGWLVDHAGPSVPFVAGGMGALALAAATPLLLPAPRRA